MDGHSKLSYLASGFVSLYGLTVHELVAIGGLIFMGLTWATNAWDKRQRRKLLREALDKGQISEIKNN